jgi:uncharacterized protein (UPF0335 family)
MINSDLRQRVESLLRLQDAVEAAQADLKQAYADAQNAGYTTAALRRAVKIHTLDAEKRAKHDQGQLDLELYLAEIEGRAMQEAAE